MSFISQIIGDPNQRVLNKIRPLVQEINKLEGQFERLSDAQLKEKTAEFRERLGVNLPSTPNNPSDSTRQASSGNKIQNETLDDLLPEAFAAVREASKRTLGLRHFDVQLIGGIVLHQGKIAEMKTGEGKTLAATLAIYLNALEGKGVHVVTVNDYLAKRDANWMGPIYNFLGMSVGSIQHDKAFLFDSALADPLAPSNHSAAEGGAIPPAHQVVSRQVGGNITVSRENLREVPRKTAYEADITYGTNNEFGFDYLRDNMVQDFSQMVQRGHHYAIVDEVDSILIDEARTPLIISAPDMESIKLYETFTKIIPKLQENVDYNIDEKMKAATLTEEGIEKVEKILGMDIYQEAGVRYVHQLEQALRAHTLFKLDRDYVVKNGEIIIVDEFTGRLMFGRRYSGGLHQAIEAKEGVKVQQESKTLATITFQNYFRMYKKLAGMTGTALTNAEEIGKDYKLDVIVIPTNKTMIRNDMPDKIFRTEKGKFMAVIKEIKELNKKGQPVLIGTVSIEKNELLSALLKKEGIAHNVLNAKNHEKEAQIIAEAGRKGAVTVATNMAGRGVDIILGGKDVNFLASPKSFSDRDFVPSHRQDEISPSVPQVVGRSLEHRDSVWQKEHDEVVALGGLHIIGTERHEARRIDNQLRGRAGRQGDPGSSQFFVSMEDDLMRIFGSDKIKRMMEIFNLPEDQPIENKMISRALESAQGKIEGFNFDIRSHVLEYDDVMNKQRETIYRKRKEILVFQANDRQDLSGGLTQPALQAASQIPAAEEDRKSLREQILGMVKNEIKKFVEFHARENYAENWNLTEIVEIANSIFGLSEEEKHKIKDFKDREDLVEYLNKIAEEKYEQKEKQFGAENMRAVEKGIMLQTIDMLWMEHLDNMDHLRDSVRLRAYGQRDPLVEYKNEGHRLFQNLLENIQAQIANVIFKIEMRPQTQNIGQLSARSDTRKGVMTASRLSVQNNKQIGRNDPCPCGATHPDGRPKKYKHCCGK